MLHLLVVRQHEHYSSIRSTVSTPDFNLLYCKTSVGLVDSFSTMDISSLLVVTMPKSFDDDLLLNCTYCKYDDLNNRHLTDGF